MTEELLAIRLSGTKGYYTPSNRYLQWMDDCWYETTNEPVHIFSSNDIEKLKKQLMSHYIYRAAFVYRNGTEEVWDDINKKQVKQIKTNGLKIKIKI